MTTHPFQDAVAIDTNVFVHLRNPERNPDGHIHHLLGVLAAQGIELLVDDRGFIHREHERNVIPMLQGSSVNGEEVYLLQYFMNANFHRKVTVDPQDRLMAAIREVIFERSKNADRTFVYVAFRQGRWLISNDITDIVEGSARESTPRRHRLLRKTRRLRTDGADILTSHQAYAAIQG